MSSGGLAVLPTESFYALSCSALDSKAVERVFKAKGRPADKPLPLVIGDAEQLSLLTDSILDLHERLMAAFWPGPLTLVFQGKAGLPAGVKDAKGRTAVRLTPHHELREICRRAGIPLTASSANSAGKAAVAEVNALEGRIIASADIIIPGRENPRGGKPSTIVAPAGLYGLAEDELLLLREGAVGRGQLEAAGFRVRPYRI